MLTQSKEKYTGDGNNGFPVLATVEYLELEKTEF